MEWDQEPVLQDARLGAEAIARQGAQSPVVVVVAVVVAAANTLEESPHNPTSIETADESDSSSGSFLAA